MGNPRIGQPRTTAESSARVQESTLDRLPTFVTVDELAAMMRVDRKTVYKAIADGEVPGACRLGRTVRITRDVVVAWLRDEARVLRSSGRNR